MIPPSILFLEFKSKEELQLMPQTVEEHIQELEDSDSDSSFDSTDEDDGESHSIAVGLAGLAMNSPRVFYHISIDMDDCGCRFDGSLYACYLAVW